LVGQGEGGSRDGPERVARMSSQLFTGRGGLGPAVPTLPFNGQLFDRAVGGGGGPAGGFCLGPRGACAEGAPRPGQVGSQLLTPAPGGEGQSRARTVFLLLPLRLLSQLVTPLRG